MKCIRGPAKALACEVRELLAITLFNSLSANDGFEVLDLQHFSGKVTWNLPCIYSHPGLDRIWNVQIYSLKWDDFWKSAYSIYFRMTIYIYISISLIGAVTILQAGTHICRYDILVRVKYPSCFHWLQYFIISIILHRCSLLPHCCLLMFWWHNGWVFPICPSPPHWLDHWLDPQVFMVTSIPKGLGSPNKTGLFIFKSPLVGFIINQNV